MKSNKVLTVILDGFGYSLESEGNAIAQADKPFFEKMWKAHSSILINTSGNFSGLPEGEFGTSESGHVTIGAGRIVWQPLESVNQSIASGDFFRKDLLLEKMDPNKDLHIMGMLSDGGCHSHIEHLFACMDLAKQKGVKNIYIHAFSDGRDVEMESIKTYLDLCEQKIIKLGHGALCSIVGRYYAMDRDSNLDRTKKAFDLLVSGEGYKAGSLDEAIEKAYEKEKNDYYIEPICLPGFKNIEKDDNIIFYNIRSDRAIQLTKMFYDNGFKSLLAFGPYTSDYPVLFPPENVKNNISEVLSRNGKTQLRIAETEKYPHVTFFLNSQNHDKKPGEDHILIPSPKVPSYADKPEMSAYEVTDRLCEEIEKNAYDSIFVNYANADLVGHSGVLKAGIKAVETLDKCMHKVVNTAKESGYSILVLADHGNAEEMLDSKGNMSAMHTTNPVICTLISSCSKKLSEENGKKFGDFTLTQFGLKDIAPTILELMGINKPEEMTGKSMVEIRK